MFSTSIAILVLLIFAGTLSIILLILQKKFPDNQDNILLEINKLLPQTQCGQCDFPGCLPYAQAIYSQAADINRCPPGGQKTIDALALLLNVASKPLAHDVKPTPKGEIVAKIDESKCIGCLLCIKACPVDAIVGADKLMHTVISDNCTGCELCVAPCPVDCISMTSKNIAIKHWIAADPEDQNYAS